MGKEREIIEALRQITGTQFLTPCFMFDAEVISVDKAARTCTVKTIGGNDPIQLEGVRLMAEVDDGFLIIPADKSRIIVTYNKNIVPFISQFSEVKEIIWTVGESTLDVVDGEFNFNGGDNFGFVKVKELTDKLNTLEKDINTLKNIFSGWSPVPSDGGAALKAAAVAWSGQLLTETVKTDIENEKIKH